jgi:hypothetical protein
MNQVPIVIDYFKLEADFQHFLAYSNYGELTEEEQERLRTAYTHGGMYDAISEFGFDLAIKALKKGHKVTREGWNGKDMFLFFVPERVSRAYDSPLNTMVESGAMVKRRAYIAMKTVNGEVVPWVPSQSDIVEKDWKIV